MQVKQRHLFSVVRFDFKAEDVSYYIKDRGTFIEKKIPYLGIDFNCTKVNKREYRWVWLAISWSMVWLGLLLTNSNKMSLSNLYIVVSFFIFSGLPILLFFTSRKKYFNFRTSNGLMTILDDKNGVFIIEELKKRQDQQIELRESIKSIDYEPPKVIN